MIRPLLLVLAAGLSPAIARDSPPAPTENLQEFGKRSATAHSEGRPIPQFSVEFPGATLGMAEITQKAFVARILEGKTFGGIKGAVVGAGGQELFGIDQALSAVLLAEGRLEAADRPEVAIREGASPGVETELGILLDKPITEPVADIPSLKSLVRAIVPVIELPAGRHDWPEKPRATDLVAANVDSDLYLVGEEYRDLSLDLDAVAIRLERDGRPINETTGGAAKGGQWTNFLRQVNWAVAQGYDLRPGHLVITGALGKISREGTGDYRADFGPLGEIRFSLVE